MFEVACTDVRGRLHAFGDRNGKTVEKHVLNCRIECVRQVGQVPSHRMPMHAATINDLTFRSCGGHPQGSVRDVPHGATERESSPDWSYGTLDDPTIWGFRIHCR